MFTENRGQWDERVLFRADAVGGLTWFIEKDGFTVLYTIPDFDSVQGKNPDSSHFPETHDENAPLVHPLKSHALKFCYIHSSQPPLTSKDIPAEAARITSGKRLSWENNYFIGNDSSRWASSCGNYEGIICHDVWEGIDVEWHQANGLVEFDLVVHPGSRPEQICMRVDGLLMNSGIASDGAEILLPTSLGELHLKLPEAWQVDEFGQANKIDAAFLQVGDNKLGFALPEDYDAGRKLVIDPLGYSTFLGGNSWDYGLAILTNEDNSVVVAGRTRSPDFPISEGAVQDEFAGGDYDMFITCLSEDLDEIIYSTYLGGEVDDVPSAIITDGTGGVIATGWTESPDFPSTEGSYQEEYGGGMYDAVIIHLTNNGCELAYSTFLGGSGWDEANGIVTSDDQEVIIAGRSTSLDYPVTDGAFQNRHRGDESTFDIIITCLDLVESELVYSTYLGSNRSNERVYGMTLSENGGVIFTGNTHHNTYPTTEGAFQEELVGSIDAYVTHLSEDGESLIFSTLLGGSGSESGRSVSCDDDGSVVLVGETISVDFPVTEGAFQPERGRLYDVFIARLSEDGSELISSTYLGGNFSDEASGIIPDGSGGWIISGMAYSDDFPLTNDACQNEFGGIYDAFITRINADFSQLIYSTYLGGEAQDHAFGVTSQGNGNIVTTGYTWSRNFPVSNDALQERYSGNGDVFLSQLNNLFYLIWEEEPEGAVVFENELIEFEIHGRCSDLSGGLSIEYRSQNIPDSAGFEDHEDGSGTFFWQTDFNDAGEYNASFILSDGEKELQKDVLIIVLNVNSQPTPFSLLTPANGLNLSYDPDSSAVIDFVWEQALQDESDTDSIRYSVIFTADMTQYTIGSLELPHLEIGIQAIADSMNLNREDEITFSWTVRASDSEAIEFASNGPWTFTIPALGVSKPGLLDKPEIYYISQNFPNPFNSSTTIEYGLPVSDYVELSIWDINGRKINTLVSEFHQTGRYQVAWNATCLPAGVYLVKMQTVEFTSFCKLMLLQ